MKSHECSGDCFVPHSADMEKGQLKFFAKGSGETNRIYFAVDAARVAVHPALPMPASFAFCLTRAKPDPFDWMPPLGDDMGSMRNVTDVRTGNVITCQSTMVEKFEAQSEQLLRLTLTARNQDNDTKLQGEAVVAINHT